MISEQEVWLRAYCAALQGNLARGMGLSVSAEHAKESATIAVKDFTAAYPKFTFVSNEGKTT